jgi:hypothetical protein
VAPTTRPTVATSTTTAHTNDRQYQAPRKDNPSDGLTKSNPYDTIDLAWNQPTMAAAKDRSNAATVHNNNNKGPQSRHDTSPQPNDAIDNQTSAQTNVATDTHVSYQHTYHQ